jgi:hypothetical protein
MLPIQAELGVIESTVPKVRAAAQLLQPLARGSVPDFDGECVAKAQEQFSRIVDGYVCCASVRPRPQSPPSARLVARNGTVTLTDEESLIVRTPHDIQRVCRVWKRKH